jgi:hypothetical protein
VEPAGLAANITLTASTAPEPIITTAQAGVEATPAPPAIAGLESCVLPRGGKCTDSAARVESDVKLHIESDGVRLPDDRLGLH